MAVSYRRAHLFLLGYTSAKADVRRSLYVVCFRKRCYDRCLIYRCLFTVSQVLTLFVTDDPIHIISAEVVFPAFSLSILLLMVEWWQPLTKALVEQKQAIGIYIGYFLFKCVCIYWVIWRVSHRFYSTDDPNIRILRISLSVGIVAFAGLVGLPLIGDEDVFSDMAILVVSYEIGWLLAAVPIAFVHLVLLKWLEEG